MTERVWSSGAKKTGNWRKNGKQLTRTRTTPNDSSWSIVPPARSWASRTQRKKSVILPSCRPTPAQFTRSGDLKSRTAREKRRNDENPLSRSTFQRLEVLLSILDHELQVPEQLVLNVRAK